MNSSAKLEFLKIGSHRINAIPASKLNEKTCTNQNFHPQQLDKYDI